MHSDLMRLRGAHERQQSSPDAAIPPQDTRWRSSCGPASMPQVRQAVWRSGNEEAFAEVWKGEMMNASDLIYLSDCLCEQIGRDVLEAAMKRRMIDAERALQRLCDEVWFPAGYRITELILVQYQADFLKANYMGRVEIRPNCDVAPWVLLGRRLRRKIRPYRYERFLGRKITQS